jgi:hypothetical protein
MPKTGRNEPCPCGSGKKYKRCCFLTAAAPRPPQGPPERDERPIVRRPEGAPSAARIAASTNARLGGGTLGLTAYSVAKITEDPSSAGDNDRLRRMIEQGLRERWTIQKVAAMTTERIEAQLAAFGVSHSRERFLALAEGRTSAWSISEVWLGTDAVSCRDTDEGFLGLAACELWKRLLPDRPSIEMIDDWMQEGYSLLESRRGREACDIWWRVWRTLRPRLSPSMTTMDGTGAAFTGLQCIFNWSQDFEMELGNAAAKDARYASLGAEYCTQWIAQFRDEGEHMQVSFRRALACFLSRAASSQHGSSAKGRLADPVAGTEPTAPGRLGSGRALRLLPFEPLLEDDLDERLVRHVALVRRDPQLLERRLRKS